MAKENKKSLFCLPVVVWLLRVVVGATFIISGWAKSVDPWGFIYKIEEYFNIWNMFVPREITLSLAIALSVCEFSVGVLIASGSMRRGTVWLAALFMAFMLPLTAYIAISEPVSDCGCFGDLWVISNTLTFVKNIVLTILVVLLIIYNDRVGGIYNPGLQWLVVVGAVAFSATLAFFGYRYQPLVDFRPYPVGSELNYAAEYEDDDASASEYFIYEKDGLKESFALDNIPDSTWTYVGVEQTNRPEAEARLAVFDGDVEVSDEVFDGQGDLLLLVVCEPDLHYIKRRHLVKEISSYITDAGGRMAALVGASGDELDAWVQVASPDYDVYSVEDISLKELVRGETGLVYIRDGRIVWKRNLASINQDVLMPDYDGAPLLSDEMAVDDGQINRWMTGIFILWLVFVYSLNFPDNILSKYLMRCSAKKS